MKKKVYTCIGCKYLNILSGNLRYGCRLLKFKSHIMPNQVIFNMDKKPCEFYEPRQNKKKVESICNNCQNECKHLNITECKNYLPHKIDVRV